MSSRRTARSRKPPRASRDFGYRRITVEPPLRLNFQASEERIRRIRDEKSIQKLDDIEQVWILAACETLAGDRLYRNRDEFTRDLRQAFKRQGLTLSAPQLKVVVSALAERDEEADICLDKKGKPEPNTDLRDYENVPLDESVYEYFEREVTPHMPEVWIDTTKRDDQDGDVGIVGYEIPFNRHFYEYQPPQPLEEIDRDLKRLSGEIQELLREVVV